MLHGFGIVEKDPNQAIEWLIKSNYPHSLLCVAHIYQEGLHVNEDKEKCKYYYDLSCKYDSVGSNMVELGNVYLYMNQGSKCVEEALFWFKKAAEKHNTFALAAVASILMTGYPANIKRDIPEAFNYLSRAAELEKVSLTLGQLKATKDHEPMEEYSGTMKWYYKSTDNGITIEEGCISGLAGVGYIFYKGLGVRRDYGQAYELYNLVLQDIDEDDSDANMCLGLLYSKGLGVEQDHKTAMQYFNRSAKSINTYNYNLIGNAHHSGKGVDTDHGKAMEWYMKGARYNDSYSQLNIGKLYMNSPKFSDDSYFAIGWFKKSYENGCKQALKFIQYLDENDPRRTNQLLTNERLARKALEREVLALKEELARIKDLYASEPAVPMFIVTQEEVSPKRLKFFDVPT